MTRVEVLMEKKEGSLVKKFLIILNGDELYELFGYLSKSNAGTIHKQVFDDFTVTHPVPAINRRASRSTELAEVLGKAEKTDADLAKFFWDELEFTTADIPALQKMSLKIYPDFDTSYYNNLNSKIFDMIESLDSVNETSGAFFVKNYPGLKGRDELIKPFIIDYISGIKTKENYLLLKNLLLDHHSDLPAVSFGGYQFYDSLALTALLYPEFMKKAGEEWLWPIVTGTTTSLLDSNLISRAVVKEYGNYFTERASKEFAENREQVENSPYTYTDLVKILGIVGSPYAVKQLNNFSKINHREIRLRSTIALIEANQPADTKTIYTLAITDEYRHTLYDELKRINRLKLFPAEFANQRQLAQSKLLQILSEDEDAPTNINYVAEKIITYKGKQQKFFLYKFSYDAIGEPWYLGVAGPYSLNTKELESNHEASGAYWDEEFDPKKTDQHFKQYMKMLAENE
jgi:hypothetical protein